MPIYTVKMVPGCPYSCKFGYLDAYIQWIRAPGVIKFWGPPSPNLLVTWGPHREPGAPLLATALHSVSMCQCQPKGAEASMHHERTEKDVWFTWGAYRRHFACGMTTCRAWVSKSRMIIIRTRLPAKTNKSFRSCCLYLVICNANSLRFCINSIFIHTFVFHTHTYLTMCSNSPSVHHACTIVV